MDIGIRVRVVASKLDHPSAQRLDAEQFERLRAEVRTLRWVVLERRRRPDWAELVAQVEVLADRVERLDPEVPPEVDVPVQARGSEERVPGRQAGRRDGVAAPVFGRPREPQCPGQGR